MKTHNKATFTITLVNGEVEKVIEFRAKNPKVSHKNLYLRGLDSYKSESEVDKK